MRHIVLRGSRDPSRDVFSAPAFEAAGQDGETRIQVEDLAHRDLPALVRERDVLAVAPAMPMRLIEPMVNDQAVAAQAGAIAWGVQAVRAHSSPFSGAGVVVAVLDTGIDPQHPAFAGVELVRRNFTTEPDDDLHGHGTHCAGTIFGRPVNGQRIGVAPGVTKALIGKVLGQGGGDSERIVSAMQWALDEGAQVLSMSLGIDFPGYVQMLVQQQDMPISLATSRALEGYRYNVVLFEKLAAAIAARQRPALVVAAAGNESRRDQDPRFEIGVSPPAVSSGILSVAALGLAEGGLKVAGFSNTGANLSAPGVDIVSAKPGGGLQAMSGTSMATPHVAGVAALWAERIQRLGPLSTLQWTARLVSSAGFEGLRPGFDPTDVGAGLVQAPQT